MSKNTRERERENCLKYHNYIYSNDDSLYELGMKPMHDYTYVKCQHDVATIEWLLATQQPPIDVCVSELLKMLAFRFW